LIAAVLTAFLWRRSQLAGLPDVGERFDVAAFRSPARVPDDRKKDVGQPPRRQPRP
jgi:hypothetical protein